MPFTLSLRADDVNDDGVADFTFEPIRGGTDWHHASQMVVWANALSETAESFEEEGEGEEEVCMPISGAAGGHQEAPGFISNPQIELKAEKAGRFYVFLDQIARTRMRATPVRSEEPSCPIRPPSRTGRSPTTSYFCTRRRRRATA